MFKQTPNICVINAATEAPPLRIGTVISCHRNREDAVAAQMEFEASQKLPRTRIVQLRRFMMKAAPVDPRDDLVPQ